MVLLEIFRDRGNPLLRFKFILLANNQINKISLFWGLSTFQCGIRKWVSWYPNKFAKIREVACPGRLVYLQSLKFTLMFKE